MASSVYPDLRINIFLSVSCPKCQKHLTNYNVSPSTEGTVLKGLDFSCCSRDFEVYQHPSSFKTGSTLDVQVLNDNFTFKVNELGTRSVPDHFLKGQGSITITLRDKTDPIEELKNGLEKEKRKRGSLSSDLFLSQLLGATVFFFFMFLVMAQFGENNREISSIRNEMKVLKSTLPPHPHTCFKARYSERTEKHWPVLTHQELFDFEVGHSGKRFLNKEKTFDDERFIKKCRILPDSTHPHVYEFDGICIKEPNFEGKSGLFSFNDIEIAKPGDCTP